jgi:Ser/Thr protein kinase RdoA (MazF antagonist)
MESLIEKVKAIIESEYDLGKVDQIEKAKLGDTNKSFIAVCEKDGVRTKYCARQYNYAKQEPEIKYEHAFDLYFNDQVCGEIASPLPIRTKSGGTWVCSEFEKAQNFYAVFKFIQGREPYSWEYNEVSDMAFAECSQITAKFHCWAYNFKKPEGSGRLEPNLLEQIKDWKEKVPMWVESMKGDSHRRKLYDYCTSQWEYILKRLDFAEAELKKYMDKLPVCIIHEDINPSNLMFDENDKVSAIFDFDWVTEGYRIYDVVWMCHQIVSSWKEDSFGYMKLDQVKKFLSIYNNTINSLNCNLRPLTDEERRFFPAMMILSCMKIKNS